MNKKKIILLAILCIFIVGMALSSVAAKTFKSNGYKYKMSKHELKYMKKQAKSQGKHNKVRPYGSIFVTKTVHRYNTQDSIEQVPVGHKLTIGGTVVKCVPKANYYKLKVKHTGRMSCYVDWVKGKYKYSSYAFDID